MSGLTQSELRQLFNFDPMTGVLTWRVSPGRRVREGARAGCAVFQRKRADRAGNPIPCRREVQIHGKLHSESRVIWCHAYGYWPSKQEVIDHINNDPFDNRLANLRLASARENALNRKRRRTRRTLLPKWVYQRGERYEASVRIDGKHRWLGAFATPDRAHKAACDFARLAHGEFFQPSDPSFQ